MHEHILAAAFLLDEAKTLLRVEEFHNALAGAHDLRRHAVETATTSAATRPTTAAAWSTATAAAKAVTAGPAVITKAIAAAEPVAAKTVARGEIVHSATEWIEAVLAKTVTFIPAPAAPSIVTHNLIRTLSRRPQQTTPMLGTDNRIGRKGAPEHFRAHPSAR